MTTPDFLRVNGWVLPAKDGNPRAAWKKPGGGVVLDQFGNAVRRQTGRKGTFSGETVLMAQADAVCAEGLLSGKMHRWGFTDDLWSEDGIGPNAGYSTTRDGTGGPWGNGSITPTSITWTFPSMLKLGRQWTVSVWRDSGSGFERYDVLSDGRVYVDGVQQYSADVSWLTVDGSALQLSGGDEFADLMVYRFLCCESYLQDNLTWQNDNGWNNTAKPCTVGGAILRPQPVDEAEQREYLAHVESDKRENVKAQLGGKWSSVGPVLFNIIKGAYREANRDKLLALDPFLYLHADDLTGDMSAPDVWPNRGTDATISMAVAGVTTWTLDSIDGKQALASPSGASGELRWSGVCATLNPVVAIVYQINGTDPITAQNYLFGTWSNPYWFRFNVAASGYYRMGAVNMTGSPSPSSTHRRAVARFGDGSTYGSTFFLDGTRYYDAPASNTTFATGNGWRLGYGSAVQMKVRAIAVFMPTVDLAAVEAAVEAQFG